ncbi:MAG: flagellar export chaperone FliS [Rubinisphaera brasiliensis]|uniref:Flagellar protein FliS n=1 Tax=Rubinisphaera brasiliensis (strain ATCC 49424 / DSM 5305 / JCM 21570 / IAM 15109 / NBRC 103401 / IFAM 1448) TaxID=756272 RepID=F0SMJ7_RUBBR|nr:MULTISPECIES: flagellar export chaperone FliS [Rubinisphaera]ADY57759.1 flagellar protein FliS [Rubinisphaera brasiliensis DSM 5305]MBR9800923.1 flagellar protein FliS [bacterium]
MYPAQYEDEYLESKVLTAPPLQLHLLTVEGALRFARQAKVSLEEKQFEQSHDLLNRSRECVSELIAGLNPDQAPEMVQSLKNLFVFVYRSLAMADLETSPARVDDAIRILESHRDTWLELIDKLSSQLGEPQPQVEQDDIDYESHQSQSWDC